MPSWVSLPPKVRPPVFTPKMLENLSGFDSKAFWKTAPKKLINVRFYLNNARSIDEDDMKNFVNKVWSEEYSDVDALDEKMRCLLMEKVWPTLKEGLSINGQYVYPYDAEVLSDLEKNYPLLVYVATPEDNKRRSIASSANGLIMQKGYPPADYNLSVNNWYRWNHLIFWGQYISERGCCTTEESVQASMAHELTHHYQYMKYPETANFSSRYKLGKETELVELQNLADYEQQLIAQEAWAAQEAFCVYVEYLYLRTLTGKAGMEFSIEDFVQDIVNYESDSSAKREYGIHPLYMVCFWRGLDLNKIHRDSNGKINHIEFRDEYLEEVNSMCRAGKYQKLSQTDQTQNYSIGIGINKLLIPGVNYIDSIEDMHKKYLKWSNNYRNLELDSEAVASLLEVERKVILNEALQFIQSNAVQESYSYHNK